LKRAQPLPGAPELLQIVTAWSSRNERLQSVSEMRATPAQNPHQTIESPDCEGGPASNPATIPKGRSMPNRTFLHRARHVALASALLVAVAGVASADPGPRGAMHGHGGPHGAPFEQAIAHVKDRLALNAEQQGMFDATVAQTRANREAGRNEMIRVRDAMRAELAKPEPDLAAVAAIADDARAKGLTERLKVRNAWLNLYGTFTTAQKQVVRDYLRERMARQDAWRDKMRESFGARG